MLLNIYLEHVLRIFSPYISHDLQKCGLTKGFLIDIIFSKSIEGLHFIYYGINNEFLINLYFKGSHLNFMIYA